MTRSLIIVLIATAIMGLAVSPALAADSSSSCVLPGFVSAVGQRPCPATPEHRSSLLHTIEHPVGSLFGGVAKGLLNRFVRWVDGSAATALRFTASLISTTTRPEVTSAWFSASYWRVAALSTLLTLPFLFAACIHALVRSDLAMAGRAAFGYLPLAMLAITIAAPLTGLLLSATDEMCAFVSDASGSADVTFLGHAATEITVFTLSSGDAFLAFFAGLLTVAATVSLWVELIIRAAAVEVIVLMLPLFFAAMVWPARRVWAIRAIETLIALILSKFAIVAVLSLGAAAITQASAGPTALLTGATLVLLAVFSPWALLRVLPLHEVAAAAAGGLSRPPRDALKEIRGTTRRWAPRLGGGAFDSDSDSDDGSDGSPDGGSNGGFDALESFHRRLTPGGSTRIDDATADPGFDPLTRAGLAVFNGAGSPGDSATVADSPASPPAAETAMPDDRPPLPAQFGAASWNGFEIGSGMQAPRIGGEETAGTDADTAGTGADAVSSAPTVTALPVESPPLQVDAAATEPPPPDVISPPAFPDLADQLPPRHGADRAERLAGDDAERLPGGDAERLPGGDAERGGADR
jgi:hypothetical protein